ncbi:MAG: ROK family protein [Deltaproteobacteria bacterium]|nr:ROK family protein [Deltaproteobacteria bacterium]
MGILVGVDLGGTHLRAATVTSDGQAGPVVRKAHGREDARTMAAAVVALAADLAKGEPVDALGIGFPGWVVPGTGHVIRGPNLGWMDEPFGQMLRSALPGARVVVVNDLKAIAWGESRFGAGRGAKVAGVVFVGSGLGTGVVTNGVLQEGATGVAGELGHAKVAIDGEPCGCGQRGCFEAYVGGANIDKRLRAMVRDGKVPALLEAAGGEWERVHVGMADAVVRSGDSELSMVWQEIGDLLGLALTAFASVHNPDKLVMGGGVWTTCPALREIATNRLQASLLPPAWDAIRMVDATLGDSAGILGAASLAASR